MARAALMLSLAAAMASAIVPGVGALCALVVGSWVAFRVVRFLASQDSMYRGRS
jgi:hypothetical protein